MLDVHFGKRHCTFNGMNMTVLAMNIMNIMNIMSLL
jgi:hypothetical protein